jgi:hypothetical protein
MTIEDIIRDYSAAIYLSQNGERDNQLKRDRFFVMQQLVDGCLERNPSHNIAEFGCWHGHSTLMTHASMLRHSCTGKLHVFDSFEGLSAFGPKDASPRFATPKAQAKERANFRSNYEHLESLVDPDRVVLHKGWIPNVLSGVDVGSVSFANIDVDLYAPTLAALHYIYPRVVDNGVIFLDDYGAAPFPGAAKAVDEFLELCGGGYHLVRLPQGGAFITKWCA